MRFSSRSVGFLLVGLVLVGLAGCGRPAEEADVQRVEALRRFVEATGLQGEWVPYAPIAAGEAPPGYAELTGVAYAPSHNEDPAIPAQCWVETGYGTQNACKYCHTDYLAERGHGNAFPTAEDQLHYAFPSPALNRVAWRNIIRPEELTERLGAAGIEPPLADDPDLMDYIRQDNWRPAFAVARAGGDTGWDNRLAAAHPLRLMPALDPDHLYPWREGDPTDGGRHGFVDPDGFVRDTAGHPTGWRAINFFPYAIFTPLTGSVSGIYIRLPERFRQLDGRDNLDTYRANLDLLEATIKAHPVTATHFHGDAAREVVRPGFYPVGTEFAHPLHYVDPNADGERGEAIDGVSGTAGPEYEFPGLRSKRLKEMRYMYKWREVGLADIGEGEEEETEDPHVLGRHGQGWIENGAGWVLAAFIEDRWGRLRPQTVEELLQCKGCHSSVGNTIDAVWSFQRKLPGAEGWREMEYGGYRSDRPGQTRLTDYLNHEVGRGEMEYFYHSVVGADLFGVMPGEVRTALERHYREAGLAQQLGLEMAAESIFDDGRLMAAERSEREVALRARAAVMRHFAAAGAYLARDPQTGVDFIRGDLFYPTPGTARANVAAYRRVVLGQAFHLGKQTFGSHPDAIPFTFRSDGTVRNAEGRLIPAGGVIDGRPYGEDGVGVTVSGIARVDAEGRTLDPTGTPVDFRLHPERVDGHWHTGGTFDPQYNPILSGVPIRRPPDRR